MHAVDPKKNLNHQFKKYGSFCHKNDHPGSTCYSRLNMLEKSESQSKPITPSFYQHFNPPLTLVSKITLSKPFFPLYLLILIVLFLLLN